MLAVLHQLESSQWLPADALQKLQYQQLELVLRHATAHSPYYRERWAGLLGSRAPATPESFAALPLLSRRDLQSQFDRLKCGQVPPHGGVGEAVTTGSTGTPVRVLKTELCLLMWDVMTLRDDAWHRRDLGGKLAMVRHGMPEGEFDNWGRATRGLTPTGPLVVMGIEHDVSAHLAWLHRQQPDYLMTHPSLLAEMLRQASANGMRPARLREVRTFGEPVTQELREHCRDAWGARIVDAYSTNEVGYIALQCPEHEHFHVQSEDLLVEILDDEGRPCAPGETGRVVVTTLHNFAMPLVRYDIGDYAEAGEACACGRGLPVIRRIAGRVRNMLVTADGRRYWPALGSRSIAQQAPVLQYQLAQRRLDLIEARLVTARPLDKGEEDALRQFFLSRLPPGLRLEFAYRESIPRGKGGKFEDFLSELADSL